MGKTKYPYKPQYCDMIVKFFSPPYYLIKDMTITKPDGTQIDKTEMEALPPIFLGDFARSIGISKGYRQIFKQWAEKHPDFDDSLKEAVNLEIERYRVNGAMGLYNASFSIFTLKNIAGWRDDKALVNVETHTHYVIVRNSKAQQEENAAGIREDTRTELPTR